MIKKINLRGSTEIGDSIMEEVMRLTIIDKQDEMEDYIKRNILSDESTNRLNLFETSMIKKINLRGSTEIVDSIMEEVMRLSNQFVMEDYIRRNILSDVLSDELSTPPLPLPTNSLFREFNPWRWEMMRTRKEKRMMR